MTFCDFLSIGRGHPSIINTCPCLSVSFLSHLYFKLFWKSVCFTELTNGRWSRTQDSPAWTLASYRCDAVMDLTLGSLSLLFITDHHKHLPYSFTCLTGTNTGTKRPQKHHNFSYYGIFKCTTLTSCTCGSPCWSNGVQFKNFLWNPEGRHSINCWSQVRQASVQTQHTPLSKEEG